MSNSKLIKLAVFGAISAVAIDHILKPTVKKSVGL